MKAHLKCLTAMLALLLSLSAFASCADVEDEESSEPLEETKNELVLDIEKKDYDDTLYLQVSSGLDYLWAEERRENVITEAVYDRQEKVEKYLGVTMVGTTAEGTHENYHIAFLNSMRNKDGAIDLYFPGAYMAIPTLIKMGCFRNLKNVDGLNLDEDHWNTEYMDSISLHDRYYLGYCDYNIAKTYVIAYNKDILAKYQDALDESVYESVRNYRWTIDKMISIIDLAYIDTTGDGKSVDDTFGLASAQWFTFIPFLHGSNIQLVDQNEEGVYQVSVFTEQSKSKTVALVEKLKAMAKSDSAWLWYRTETTPRVEFNAGRSLMTLEYTKNLEKYLEYDMDFGILPYPMFDEAQRDVGYRSWNYDNYLTIPSYLENEQMVVETVELLAYYSEPVRYAVFEKMLGKQVSQMPDDADMLEIVWDGICSDFGLTYSHISGSLDKNLYMLPTLTYEHTTENVSSYVQGYSSVANNAIKNFLKAVARLEDK